MRVYNILVLFFLAMLLIIIGIGCEKDNGPTTPTTTPVLSVSTTSLNFERNDTRKTFTINNIGEETLEWTITSTENWIMVSPNEGSTTDESDTITVIVGRHGLSDGQYSGIITVIPNASDTLTVSIQMIVQSPILSLSTSSLNFSGEDTVKTFTIANNGGGTLDWSITDDQVWLSSYPPRGSTIDETDAINVTIDRSDLSDGVYNGTITVTANSESSSTISVQMIVRNPLLSLSTMHLDFGSEDTVKSFMITNAGGGTLDWSISYSSSDWLSVSPRNGLTANDTDIVVVTVNREDLKTGPYNGDIRINTNVSRDTISVDMSVGILIWSYQICDNNDLDDKWICSDRNSGSGRDYWGVVTDEAHSGDCSVWCNGRGDHPDSTYDNNMDAWMMLKDSETIDIRDYDDVIIRYWMKFETENTDMWGITVYNSENLAASIKMGGEWFSWVGGIFEISSFNEYRPLDLKFGFTFESNSSIGYRGVYIDDIEVWGIPRR
ncbi:hypothetical protein K9N50_03510 [bacterium]|nr:hypothetical protein [bacterium]